MADKFDPLIAEVESLGTVVESAVAVITNLADQLIDAKDDPEQITAIAEGLRAKKERLAAAVAANTEASEETPPPVTGSENPV